MATFNASVPASNSDGVQRISDNTINRVGNIQLNTTFGWAFLRFEGVTIPQGSTINSAVLTVEVANTSNDDPKLDIHCEAADDVTTLSLTAGSITAKTFTTDKTAWVATGIGAGFKNSPNFANAVQEVISRPGWVSGNALAVILVGQASPTPFLFQSWDTGTAPAIAIDYTEPPTAAMPRTGRIRLSTKVGGVLTQ